MTPVPCRLTCSIERDEKDEGWDLVVRHDKNIVACESDKMEPEDAIFPRDLSWIKDLVARCYQIGLVDGATEVERLKADAARLDWIDRADGPQLDLLVDELGRGRSRAEIDRVAGEEATWVAK